jgi:hypothetical protein
MVRQVVASQCGIIFDQAALAHNLIPLFSFSHTISADSGCRDTELDKLDAIQPIHDELQMDRQWWLLELIPLHYMFQDAQGVWRTTYG